MLASCPNLGFLVNLFSSMSEIIFLLHIGDPHLSFRRKFSEFAECGLPSSTVSYFELQQPFFGAHVS